MSQGWNAWYHVMCNTYGTWLRGDPRGWRERHHRRHVEGDYKHPPGPGTWEATFAYSKSLMPRPPVALNENLAGIAIHAIVDCLLNDHVQVMVAALDDHHLHLVGKFPDHQPRVRLGWAKLAATRSVKSWLENHPQPDLELATGEGLWGKRSAIRPIKGRAHQLRAIDYVADHEDEGATVWSDPRVIESRRIRGIGRKTS